MDTGHDGDCVRCDAVEDRVRKSSDQRTPDTAKDDRVQLRAPDNRREPRLDSAKELEPEARGLFLVPEEGVGKVRLRAALEPELRHLSKAVQKASTNLGPGRRIGRVGVEVG